MVGGGFPKNVSDRMLLCLLSIGGVIAILILIGAAFGIVSM